MDDEPAVEGKLRRNVGAAFARAEFAIYSVLAVLLAATALGALAGAATQL